MLQIMPELRELCGGSVLPLSVEQLKVDPPEISIVALPPSSPLESSQIPDAKGCGDLDVAVSAIPLPATVEHVMPVSDMSTEPSVVAPTPNPDALFAKELCDLLTSVEVAKPGLGRSIACLLTGTPIRGKQKKVGKGKSCAIGKASLTA